jgi:Ca-activated chloride channel family protein
MKLRLAIALSASVALAACSQGRDAGPDTGANLPPSAAVADSAPVVPIQSAPAPEAEIAAPQAPPPAVAELHQAPPRAIRRSGHEAPALAAEAPAAAYSMAPRRELAMARAAADVRIAWEPANRENYAEIHDNPLRRAAEDPVSTFSIDVDTGAYANVRRMLRAGSLPVQDAVRAEELINYFDYDYGPPADAATPFSLTREISITPWNPDTYLLHIGIQGYRAPAEGLPPANLVFLVDVSGSMNSPDKLPLLKTSLRLLSSQLDAKDSVSIVVYAGASGLVLEPTPGDQRGKILAALEQLQAGGSTNGGAGIRLAYAMAEQAFIPGGINRVLLATDGDFNVGVSNLDMLLDLVEEKRKGGIALTTLGFGTGNYNDRMLERLADAGNGNHAYIDTVNEAQKVLVEELGSTMHTIAKDVKIQVEFNPAVVAEYRLIGYENRALAREDFNNDKVDAGEIGAGHSVTALYEIALVGGKGRHIDPLRYGAAPAAGPGTGEIAFLRIRYKEPSADASRLLEWPILRSEVQADLARTSDDFRFAAAVAAFAQNLRGGKYTGAFGYPDVVALARGARGADASGYRGEFLTLVNLAGSLAQPDSHASR